MATEHATYKYLHQLIDEGAIIKKTLLTAEFGYDEFVELHQERFVPLMLLQDKQVTVCTINTPINPEAGWTLISLLFDSKSSLNGQGNASTELEIDPEPGETLFQSIDNLDTDSHT